MKEALLIVDYVNDFVSDTGRLTCGKPGQNIENNIVHAIKYHASMGHAVISIVDSHDSGDIYNKEANMFNAHCFEEEGRKLYGEVYNAFAQVQDSQKFALDKIRYSAFCGTPLAMKLRERKVTKVNIVGVCTDICVLHTAVDAYNLGYDISIYNDCVASFNSRGAEFALEHMKNCLGAKIISSSDVV